MSGTLYTYLLIQFQETMTLYEWWQGNVGQCRLMTINDYNDIVRLILELIVEISALFYIFAAIREAGFLGLNMFIENLVTIRKYISFSKFFLI